MKALDVFLIRHSMRLTGTVATLVLIVDIVRGRYLDAVALAPAAGLLLIWPRSLNYAFQSGWRAASRSYDDALAGQLDEVRRGMLLMASAVAMPTYAEHSEQLARSMTTRKPDQQT